MSQIAAVLEQFERVLEAQARALTSGDPTELERCNSDLARVLGQLRSDGPGNRGRHSGQGGLDLLRARLVAQGALVARMTNANRAALDVLGLVEDERGAPGPVADRLATHLLA